MFYNFTISNLQMGRTVHNDIASNLPQLFTVDCNFNVKWLYEKIGTTTLLKLTIESMRLPDHHHKLY